MRMLYAVLAAAATLSLLASGLHSRLYSWVVLTFPGGERRAKRFALRRRYTVLELDGLRQTSRLNFDGLERHAGGTLVWAQASSRTRDDMQWGKFGGLPERRMPLSEFVNSIVRGGSARPRHDYVKMLDDQPSQKALDGAGERVQAELAAALERQKVWHTCPMCHWSLWVGANGSVTSMHWDYQRFSLLHVVEGRKRIVLIDPAFEFSCDPQPVADPVSCWSGLDILSSPPLYAREVVLEAGHTLVIPPRTWHAVENLAPTIAWGLNEWAADQEPIWTEGRWRPD